MEKGRLPQCRLRTGQRHGTAGLNNGAMGRTSRRRAQRRAGERELTPREIRRYAEKANRRARRLEPTVDDFTRAAGQGSVRLAEALIARSTVRMDNILEIPAVYSMEALESITSMLALDKALAKVGIPLRRMPSDYQGRLPRHLAWGVDSSIAACRLLLVGQIAGAAVIARQQLEHWTMFLSKVAGIERGDSSIQEFIARCWNRFTESLATQSSEDAAVLGEVSVDEFPLDDDELIVAEPVEHHEHVVLGDGVSVCPAVLYGELSDLLHANAGTEAVRWEAVDYLTPDRCSADIVGIAASVVHVLQLSLIQIHFMIAGLVKDRDPGLAAITLVTMPAFGNRSNSPVAWRDFDPVPTLGESVPVEQFVSPEIATLMPLTVEEGLRTGVVNHAAERSRLYEAVVAGRRPEGRLYRNDELATVAFDAHRYSSAVCAAEALGAESRRLGAGFDANRLTGRGAGYVVVAEAAALLSRWSQARPELSASAALISSTLRSAYWLWLEDDDRSMATLRCTLEQTARLRVWHLKQDKAAQLSARPATMPKDWLDAAGWRRLAALNRAFSEYAHAHEKSRWGGARRLLAMLQIDGGDDALFTARGAALDFTASLAVREVIRVIGDDHSEALADALADMVAGWGIDVDLDDAALNPELDHIWSHRQTALGPTPLRWD